ncbi:hypothetical protein JXB27_02700 [Candidatus Woesearchaeota archaeon]|nr:hypothetical protein [Candidatus Woesearchaeota archaeon]
MKRLLLLLLLVPFVYAEADMFTVAKQAQLDAQAYVFIAKMNYAIEFLNSRSINTAYLTKIKTDFETKLSEAMQTPDKDILNSKQDSMKGLAKEFREAAKISSSGSAVEMKAYVNSKYKEDDILKGKTARAKELRKQLVFAAFETKIEKLKLKINEERKEGKEARVEVLLLDAFETEKKNIDKLEFGLSRKTSYETASDVFDGIVDAAGSIGKFFAKGYSKITGGEDE